MFLACEYFHTSGGTATHISRYSMPCECGIADAKPGLFTWVACCLGVYTYKVSVDYAMH